MRMFALITFAILLAAARLPAQATTSATTTIPSTEPASDAGSDQWEFSLSAYAYIVPDDRDYLQPTFTADRGLLHLEARYNYEALDTGSLWIGCNFSFGKDVTLELTPMIGGVFGDTNGVAPGYKATLTWWQLELYTEGEFLFDTNDSSESFFYTWSELSVWPVEWFRVGFVVQRTRAYETDFDFQRGFLIGLVYKDLFFTTYVFNPDDDPTIVLGVGIDF